MTALAVVFFSLMAGLFVWCVGESKGWPLWAIYALAWLAGSGVGLTIGALS